MNLHQYIKPRKIISADYSKVHILELSSEFWGSSLNKNGTSRYLEEMEF
jgi:hypothetical protein